MQARTGEHELSAEHASVEQVKASTGQLQMPSVPWLVQGPGGGGTAWPARACAGRWPACCWRTAGCSSASGAGCAGRPGGCAPRCARPRRPRSPARGRPAHLRVQLDPSTPAHETCPCAAALTVSGNSSAGPSAAEWLRAASSAGQCAWIAGQQSPRCWLSNHAQGSAHLGLQLGQQALHDVEVAQVVGRHLRHGRRLGERCLGSAASRGHPRRSLSGECRVVVVPASA